MTFWYLLICSVLLFCSIPCLRFVYKRIKCAQEIKRLCKKKGFRTLSTSVLWQFCGNRRDKCELYIETPSEIYSVKLFHTKKRRSILLLWEDGRYSVRSFIAVISYGTPISYPIDSTARKLPAYDFRYRFQDEWEIKTPHRILLVNPVTMEFRRKKPSGAESVLGDGESVNGMRVCSLPRLLMDLENAI